MIFYHYAALLIFFTALYWVHPNMRPHNTPLSIPLVSFFTIPISHKEKGGGMHGKSPLLFFYLILLNLFLSPSAFAAYELNFQEPVTDIAENVYELHMLIFWICVAIACIVFTVMIISIIFHRKSRGHKAANFHESTTIEIIWTTIPFLILLAMAIPATKTLIAMEESADAPITVKITASQFRWHYEYLNEKIAFTSNLATPNEQIYENVGKDGNYLLEVDNPLVLPVDTRVRFLLTSTDVIHAWWVPAISVKKDAIPGFINEMWTKINKTGTYRGQCAELCGAGHGFMPIVLEAKSTEDYQAWIQDKYAEKAREQAELAANKIWEQAELMQRGKAVYTKHCAVCHQPTGKGIPPTFPALDGSPMINEQPVTTHINLLLAGRNAMPTFSTVLNDIEIAAVITYERNAWGNKTGDIVQPSTISAARAAQ